MVSFRGAAQERTAAFSAGIRGRREVELRLEDALREVIEGDEEKDIGVKDLQ